MKLSEVRIGNFVWWNGVVVKVTSELLHAFISGTADFEPVPLDQDWLRKFGFLEFNYPDSRSRWFSDDVLELELKRDNTYILKTFEIKSVHQLQNVYLDLTGDELTIAEEV